MSETPPNFDPIAKPYHWLEYLTFGQALQNTRLHYLPALLHCRNALILGDGDGRFTAALLTANPHIKVLAVDTSATMLQLLRQRCEATTPNATTRLQTIKANTITFPIEGVFNFNALPPNSEDNAATYDLIVTHFFLDCLTQPELNTLITRTTKQMQPGALWLLSDFRIPTGPMQLPAKLLVSSLYRAFRILTNLRTTHLPDHATPLQQSNLTRIAHQHRLAGLLTTELWQI